MLHRQLQTAQGFYNLGMTEDAWEELQQVAAEHRLVPEYLQLSLAVLMKKGQWEEAIPVAERLCVKMSDMPDPFLNLAFCLHEQGLTAKAKDCLIQGPPSLTQVSTYYYNLACYEARLGNLENARSTLEIACKMNPEYASCALEDPDLEPLR
jgi:tetratricopeptide (TPR) repeat protein